MKSRLNYIDKGCGNLKNQDVFDSKALISDDASIKYLYHYTTLETFLEHILMESTLRLSPFEKVNDPIESKRNFNGMYMSKFRDIDLNDKRINKYENQYKIALINWSKVVCFSLDDIDDLKEYTDHINRGYGKPRMWAQYADLHRGVCLIFDRELLGENMKESFSDSDITGGKVIYKNHYNYEVGIPHSFDYDNMDNIKLIKNQILEHKDNLFFTKFKDWADEKEYRYIVINEEKEFLKISFKSELKGIVLGSEFPKVYLPVLKEYFKDYDTKIRQIKWVDYWITLNKI